MAIKMIVLSLLAIMAHFCAFPVMQSNPLTYLLYLLYFRSRHCTREINWIYLGLQDLQFVEAELPNQSASVTRTLTIVVLYLILNVLLSLAAVASLRECFIGKLSRWLTKLIFNFSFNEK